MLSSQLPRSYPYYDAVEGLKWINDPDSYAAVALLRVGSPMPERAKVMTQIKRVTLVLRVGGWAWG
jgi:hypothetical protein